MPSNYLNVYAARVYFGVTRRVQNIALILVCLLFCFREVIPGDILPGDYPPPSPPPSYGSRSFAVSGPRVWNDLPPTLRSSSTTLGQFQSRLKTTLFHLAYGM